MDGTKSGALSSVPVVPTLGDVIPDKDNEHLKPSFDKRRNTDEGFFLCSSFNKDLLQQRRHTIVSGATKKELLEKETKLIVLEFLQKNTPRNEALTYRLECEKKSPQLNTLKSPHENYKTEEMVQQSSSGSIPCCGENSVIGCIDETKAVDWSVKEKNNKKSETSLGSGKGACKKRAMRKQRKISAEKAKTITIGESERKKIVDELRSNRCEDSQKKRGRYRRSSSDVTHVTMKRKCKEMQAPLIKWLNEHVRVENYTQLTERIDETNEDFIVVPETAELVESTPESAGDGTDNTNEMKSKRLKPNLM